MVNKALYDLYPELFYSPVVSSRGQWDYPGRRTIVPTPNGRITMRGVPYPVYGQDETGYGQMMYPGQEYQFRGQMVDEIPIMQPGGEKPSYGREITYVHQPAVLYDGLTPIGPGEQYMLKRTVTPYKSKRDIKKFTQVPTDPRQVNFLSNYAGATGEPLSKDFQYPTSVPYTNEQHWNIDRFIIDPQFRNSEKLNTTESTKEEMKKNVLADMYKYFMFQNKGDRDDAWKQAKKFVRQEINPRVKGEVYDEYLRKELPIPNILGITSLVDDSYLQKYNTVRNNALYNAAEFNDVYSELMRKNPLSERKAFKVGMDWLMNYKGLSRKEAEKVLNKTKELPEYEQSNSEPMDLDPSKWKDGGEILKFQPGGAVLSQRQWLQNWMNSPRYTEMLRNSTDQDDPVGPNIYFSHRLNKKRNENLQIADVNFVDNSAINPSEENATNKSRVSVAGITSYGRVKPNDEYVSSYFGRLNTQGSKPQNPYAEKNPYVFSNLYDNVKGELKINIDNQVPDHEKDEDILHELSHATDISGHLIPLVDLNKMKQYADIGTDARAKFRTYVAKPSETRARLNTFRYNASQQKLYDPFTQKAPADVFNKYKAKSGEYDPLLQLRMVYSDDEILDMLNSISKKQQPTQGLLYAKAGGQMIRRADGTYSRRGLWDNIRANRGSGRKPTQQMLKQERRIKHNYK